MIVMFIIIMMFYMAGAGVVGKTTHQIGTSKCTRKVHDWEHCGHYYTGILAGTFWPLALPLSLGMKSTDVIPTEASREAKEDVLREKEIKRKNHEIELERMDLMHEEARDRQLELAVRRGEHQVRLLELEMRGADPIRESDINTEAFHEAESKGYGKKKSRFDV